MQPYNGKNGIIYFNNPKQSAFNLLKPFPPQLDSFGVSQRKYIMFCTVILRLLFHVQRKGRMCYSGFVCFVIKLSENVTSVTLQYFPCRAFYSREMSVLLCNRSNAFYNLNKWDEAFFSAQESIQYDPTYVKVLCALYYSSSSFI